MLQHCAQLPALLIDRLPSGLLHMLHTLTLFVVLAVAAGPAGGTDACIALDWGKCVLIVLSPGDDVLKIEEDLMGPSSAFNTTVSCPVSCITAPIFIMSLGALMMWMRMWDVDVL
jgi:hypothetical protein